MNNTTVDIKQYLTFKLREEIYAFPVFQVKEVLEKAEITKLPKMPDFILGMINVRGSVVQIIDLGKRFDLTEHTGTTRNIILLEQEVDDELLTIGVLVDEVFAVIDLSDSDIDAPPKMGSSVDNRFIKGIGKDGDKFIIILIPELILSTDELELVHGLK